MTHRCDFCGRFFSSPLPDAYGCPDHIPEGNAKLRASIERHNRRITSTQVAKAREAGSADADPFSPDGESRSPFPDSRKQDA